MDKIAQMAAGSVVTAEQIRQGGELFTAQPLPEEVFQRMAGKSFPDHCTTPREALRYLRLVHRGFDGETHLGELVCSQAVAEDLLEVFRILYQEGYPIEKVRLIDEYDADDERSMADNNSSGFCFRRVAGKEELSNHSTGRAIDINPLYNPYITERGFTPLNGGDYVDRGRDFPHKIDENDLCYRLLTERGFEWGGHWSHAKDYQHFQRLEEKET
jgi:hypothetical protein